MARTVSFESLQNLIDELTKGKPSQAKVRRLMQENGLDYTTDSIQQMSSVLTLMSQLTFEAKKKKSKEKNKNNYKLNKI